ncbi:MAG: DEAD/DEAH box helicase [Acidimicrobiales bacterium]|nr:DEAD/DEAH box helicase [Acidimicrobiales bacterium]
MTTTFAQLGVPGTICDALARNGITEPFAIQAATIIDALAGRDVCGRAPTGSGKTLAFGIPLVVNVEQARPKRPRALVLAPTRELAEQIHEDLRTFAGPVRIGVVYGGVGYGPQIAALRRGVDILVACPGRLEDLIQQGLVDLGNVDHVVLDEADRMADMGFMPAVRRLLDQTSSDRQTVLFSATLDGDVAKLTRDHQRDPVHHEVGEDTPDITAARHLFWKLPRAERTGVLAEAVGTAWPAIVFCRTRHGSDRLARQLGKAGIRTAAIHGGRSQSQRTRALSDFINGKVHALVATDVAARGIHVDDVAAVFHFDPPEDHKAYIHRSGRTARAGRSGVVISFLTSEQVREAHRMQRAIGLDEPVDAPDTEALLELVPSPATAARAVAYVAPEHTRGGERERHNRNSGRDRRGRGGQRNRSGRSRSQSSQDREGKDSERSDQRNGGGNSSNRSRNGKPRTRSNGSGNSTNRSRSSSGNSTNRSRNGNGNSTNRSRNGNGSGNSTNRSRNGNGSGNSTNRSRNGNGNGGKPRTRSNGSNGGPNRKARRAHLQRGVA